MNAHLAKPIPPFWFIRGGHNKGAFDAAQFHMMVFSALSSQRALRKRHSAANFGELSRQAILRRTMLAALEF
jgi:hypothetical protein